MYYWDRRLGNGCIWLLDVVLAKAPSEWMKSPPGGPLYSRLLYKCGDDWIDKCQIDKCRMGKVRPTEARKTYNLPALDG